METVHRDYAPRGVQFYYIYKALAHPETNGYITPFSLKERLMHIAEAKKKLGSRIPWLCDSMENELKHALGDRPNSEFVIDPEGRIVVARSWSRPSELREDLARLVGQSERITRVNELNMAPLQPPQRAATGVVERVSIPGRMSPMKVTPLPSDQPFYAKLRAEYGSGQLYLGFFLDPLYQVHWNNQAPPIEFSLEPPSGLNLTPRSGTGPKLEVEADADPREFLIKVDGQSRDPIKVTVKYFACDDAQTFCVPVTQEYLVTLERDRDGGSRRSMNQRGGDRSTQWLRRFPAIAALDQDADGQISQDEIEMASDSLLSLDVNGDGELTADELAPNRR